ncbi:MAG: uracil-DNA glycosylase, partial [Candidatus Omnitrophica bacterium]|nr:uracil-DNA glycosylase [Candidatus Omnitrophota bacterium]
KMIEAINLKRENVYIANILKCRPPNNRSPMPNEIAACAHFIIAQISIIKPKVICALGKCAAQFLIKGNQPISVLRGRFHKFGGIKVMPTFHPAYLLRNPADKRLAWEDLKKVRDALEKS